MPDLNEEDQSRPQADYPANVKVVEWISYDEAADKPEAPIGGLGGWFGFDQDNTWQDYLDSWCDYCWPYAEAMKADVIESGRFINGAQHQNDPEGVPLFDDGRVLTCSYRGWGDLMAAIAVARDGKPHNYMEFYC